MKTTAILVLMLIGVCVSLSCNMCGRECVPACGTRHFRSCCFNYLRRKRGPETMQDDQWLLSDSLQRPEFTNDMSKWKTSPELFNNEFL